MAKKKPSYPLKLGGRVKIRSSDWTGRIVEERGPLGPGGVQIYRVRIPHKPTPIFIEVREDQLVVIPTPPKVGSSALLTTPRSEPQPPEIRPKKNRSGQ
jgi:hypothetical protein